MVEGVLRAPGMDIDSCQTSGPLKGLQGGR